MTQMARLQEQEFANERIREAGMPTRALIFDVDGTLAETEEIHRFAFNETFAAMGLAARIPDLQFGWKWDVPTYTALLHTTGGKERIAAYMRDYLGVDPGPRGASITEIHEAKTARYVQLIEGGDFALRPGIAALVEAARGNGLRLAIATTTSRPNVDALCLAGFGMPAAVAFDVIAAGDEVSAKKPAPDVYNLALARLGLPAADCVAFEDSLNGVTAAKSAGLRCLASPSLYTAADDLSLADAVYPGFDRIPAAAWQ